MTRLFLSGITIFCAYKTGVYGQTCSPDVQKWVINDPVQARSFSQAVNCTGGNFEVEWNGRVLINETIRVLDGTTMTVTGVNNAFIDGAFNIPIIYVENASLHMSNIVLGNGYAGYFSEREDGGAIYSEGSVLTFDTITFQENYGYDGGALYIKGSSVSFTGKSSFLGNQGQPGSSHRFSGGAIFSERSDVYWSGEMDFTNNTAYYGGAIFANSSNVAWSGETTFIHNLAGNTALTSYGEGGVFYIQNSTVSWDGDSYFVENSATRYGGVMYTEESNVSWSTNSSFIGNNAGFEGGVFFLYESSVYWSGDSYFIGNSADSSYGVIYAGASNVSWSGNSSFIGNSAGDNGGVFGVHGANVYWSGDTTFSDNYAVGYGGVFVLFYYSQVSWNATTSTPFYNNTGDLGGAIYAKWSKVNWSSETSFVGNNAVSGGSLYLDQSEASWSGVTSFVNNTAGGQEIDGTGGAIYVENANVENEVVTLSLSENTSFVGNSANSFGGAIYLQNTGIGIVFTNTTFTSNVAVVGGSVYSLGSGTDMDHTTYDGCIFEYNIAEVSGGAIDSAAGFDTMVNTIFFKNSANSGGALRLSGKTVLDNCTFEENISKLGLGPAISNIGVQEVTNISFIRNEFNCEPGTFREYELGDFYGTVCDGCSLPVCGFWNISSDSVDDIDCLFDAFSPTCTHTLEHSESDGGNTTLDKISVAQGFWRATPTSREILQCHNEDSCLGGVTDSSVYCEEGYEGPYCSICSDGYSEHLSFSCRKCSEDNVDTIVVVTLLSISFLVAIVCLASYLTSSSVTDSRWGPVSMVKRCIPLQSFKILVVTWQILTQFSSVANVVYPSVYQEFLDGLDFFNFDFSWILSAGCVFDVNFHDRILVATIGPIVALVFLACTYTVASRMNRGDTAVLQRINDKHMSMVLLLTFLVYSSVSSVLFKAFACESLEDGLNYVRSDYRIECDSSKHIGFQVYAGIMIVLYTIGIPVFYSFLLFRDRDILEIEGSSKSSRVDLISDLWEPYRPKVFYYEILECFRRIMLSSVVVFIYPNTSAQIAITLILSFAFVVISEAVSPYVSRWDRWISRLGQIVVFVSMYIALLLKVDVSGERYSSQQIFEGILVTVHACMILLMIFEAIVTLYHLKVGKKDVVGEDPAPRFQHAVPIGFLN